MSKHPNLSQMHILGVRLCPIDRWRNKFVERHSIILNKLHCEKVVGRWLVHVSGQLTTYRPPKIIQRPFHISFQVFLNCVMIIKCSKT